MKHLSTVLALFAVSSHAHAVTGNDWSKVCEGNEYACEMYIAALIDNEYMHVKALGGKKGFCMPEGVTYEQAKDIVLKYYKEHPEARHYVAASTIWAVLHETWPCKDDRAKTKEKP
jgi:hypothetical protein